jgi:outer membrane immunogenic protein
MKKLLLATTAFVALAAFGPAEAADLSRPVMKAPPVVRPACAQFGGFYLGGHVGATYYKHEYKDLDAFGFANIDALPFTVSNTDYAWLGGVQAGYNWQTGCTVFGIEADWSWTNAKAESFHTDGEGGVTDSLNVESRMRWFGTVRARTGVVVDNLLIYATGGLAYARFNRDLTFFEDGIPGSEIFSQSRTRWGWTAGLGTEWAFTGNWSLKSEVLYMQFEKDEVRFTSALIAPGVSTRFDHQDSAWVSKIGLNYRFGGPAVAAKY